MTRGVILAAGSGSRMGKVTQTQPKCRVVLHGRSLIQWQLDGLNGAGVRDIAVVRGYLGDTFDLPLTYFENYRWCETNMVTSLCCAADWLDSDTCIVSYADIAYLPRTIERLVKCDADIGITYDPDWLSLWRFRYDDPISDAETFRIVNSQIVEIGSRPGELSEIEGQFMGLLRFTPAGWGKAVACLEALSSTERDQLDMTGLLQRLIVAKVPVVGVPINEPWCEVDTSSDLQRYRSVPMWEWRKG